LATRELYAAGPCRNEKQAKKFVVEAVKRVAQRLGNRPATCRKYYIHPAILDAYSDGRLFSTMEAGEQQQAAYGGLGLRPEEYSVMVIIADHQEKVAREAQATTSRSHRSSSSGPKRRRLTVQLATIKKTHTRNHATKLSR